MRILVLSDSHGRNSNMWEVIERVGPDMIFHLGDSEDETEAIKERAGCPCEFVKGNCDYDRDRKSTRLILGGVDIYNPGSISLPRQDGRMPTFMVIDVDGKGEWHVTLNEFKIDGSRI